MRSQELSKDDPGPVGIGGIALGPSPVVRRELPCPTRSAFC